MDERRQRLASASAPDVLLGLAPGYEPRFRRSSSDEGLVSAKGMDGQIFALLTHTNVPLFDCSCNGAGHDLEIKDSKSWDFVADFLCASGCRHRVPE